MKSIPPDVIQEILARSPVKDLVRFNCLSKYSKTLISSPDFFKLHLSYPQKSDSDLYGITGYLRSEENPSFTLFHMSNSVSVATLDPPSAFDRTHQLKIVGSCNGLIALIDVTDVGAAGIWNPFAGEFKNFTFPTYYFRPLTFGFG